MLCLRTAKIKNEDFFDLRLQKPPLSLYIKQTILNAFYLDHHLVMYWNLLISGLIFFQ